MGKILPLLLLPFLSAAQANEYSFALSHGVITYVSDDTVGVCKKIVGCGIHYRSSIDSTKIRTIWYFKYAVPCNATHVRCACDPAWYGLPPTRMVPVIASKTISLLHQAGK